MEKPMSDKSTSTVFTIRNLPESFIRVGPHTKDQQSFHSYFQLVINASVQSCENFRLCQTLICCLACGAEFTSAKNAYVW